MSKLGWGAVLALGATFVVAQEKGPPTGAGPRIRVEPASFDFGRAAPNKTLHKEFSIRNFGNADLVIESVSTTCGCTAALMESKVVKPGGTTPLRVSLETRTYKGRVVRSVLLRSNDPHDDLLEDKVEATVEPVK
ncbi:MAG TPA: DUF1573 domain-containing protein [Vicinamibacteria bacterium]